MTEKKTPDEKPPAASQDQEKGEKAKRKTAPAKPAKQPPAKRSPAPPARRHHPVAWLALLLSLAAGGGLYYLWAELNAARTTALFTQNSLQNRLSALETTQSETEERLGTAHSMLEQIRAENAALEETLNRLDDRLGRDRMGWSLAEVEYLLLVANRRLQLERDIPGATAALEDADARLKTLADPALLPVRRQIASELQALRAVTPPDIEGLALELGSLAGQADTLPLPGEQRRFTAAADERAAAPEERGTATDTAEWRVVVTELWEALRSLVVVRRAEVDAVPLHAPEARFFLRENLRLKLESARLALLERREPLYRVLLEEADGWLARHFDGETASVAAAREQINRLQSATLRPALPEIDRSLRTLRQTMERLAREEQVG